MRTRLFSSRDFTRSLAAAKEAAFTGPGLITERGQPAFVMLNMGEYHRLQGKAPSLFARMQQLPERPDGVFKMPRMAIERREAGF